MQTVTIGHVCMGVINGCRKTLLRKNVHLKNCPWMRNTGWAIFGGPGTKLAGNRIRINGPDPQERLDRINRTVSENSGKPYRADWTGSRKHNTVFRYFRIRFSIAGPSGQIRFFNRFGSNLWVWFSRSSGSGQSCRARFSSALGSDPAGLPDPV